MPGDGTGIRPSAGAGPPCAGAYGGGWWRGPSLQDTLLRDIPAEQLRQRPPGGFSSLAWLLWHMTRTEDIGINVVIARRPQVLDADGWASRLAVVRRDLGTGMTDDEVDAFDRQIDLTALLAYRAAVGRHTQHLIRVLHPAVLDEVIDATLLQQARDQGAFGPQAEWVRERWAGKPKAFTLSWTVLAHTFVHLGEGHVVRRLLGFDTV